jgi:hypothetical protein
MGGKYFFNNRWVIKAHIFFGAKLVSKNFNLMACNRAKCIHFDSMQ